MSSLQYGKKRIQKLQESWHLSKVNDLFVSYKIPKKTYTNLQNSIKLYISKALDFDLILDDTSFMKLVIKTEKTEKTLLMEQ